ncbi:MAG: histidinol dehydrogenase [Deltaproteobacteria bacterium]|nr:histidinol dehydrogenase [Deltaproteobacteria bacterium]
MKIVNIKDGNFQKVMKGVLTRGDGKGEGVEGSVREILRDVRKRGDMALVGLTKRFDGVDIRGRIRVKKSDIGRALKKIPEKDMELLRLAKKRIEAFHRRQKEDSWSVTEKNGITLGLRITPLERVGIYVPGGKASYPSSVLMNAVPARVAGVDEIMMCTPPCGDDINPYVLAAASICGVDGVFRTGGAQAIAAMAYGTETVPRVDKIVGPGNIYVATAKKLVFGKVDIDMVAGPSEVIIVNDGSGSPAYIAMDLLSQAEHDELASSILITTSPLMAERVRKEVQSGLKKLKRRSIAKVSIERRGVIFVVPVLDRITELVNAIAPEHLELQVKKPLALLRRIRNAGAVFLGPYTPEAAGDYLAGPNHTLPTAGTARFSSPLGVYDFVKSTSVVRFSRKALRKLGPSIERLASIEGLEAHAKSVRIRL